jgi:hypothetical protein
MESHSQKRNWEKPGSKHGAKHAYEQGNIPMSSGLSSSSMIPSVRRRT